MTTEHQSDTKDKKDGQQTPLDSFWGSFTQGVNLDSVTRDFLHGGKTIDEQLPQCVLKDQNELNWLLLFLSKVERYEMNPRYAHIILRYAKGKAAIKGRGRVEALMSHVQVFAPSYYTGKGDEVKRSKMKFLRRKKKKDEDEDEN